ncbi:unnamed protein product [Bursaphelenchus xylophilus]|uniref:(pine wood nematode) hypothetical protein n=1 Tax=Bursaphelenchus xylophilus TaxID=6326 RepID=A0A811JZ17_BURXY|nr:unnamed protein product [Bursaphelenchus xylophilus]CAG9081670.1 unnamed protein product [Bursaphelenchus xylophilus]
MPQIQIFSVRGALLVTIQCSTGDTVKELVKNAMESKKLRFEEARCLKQQEKDGNWAKIRWKDKVGDDDSVYRITKDPQKLLLKHRVRVVDYDGEEVALLPTKSGKFVRNIVDDVCRQLDIELRHVYVVELMRNGKISVAKKNEELGRNDYLMVTVDAEERELLLNYKHPKSDGGGSTTIDLDPKELLRKLENGEPATKAETRLLAKCTVPPLRAHCLKRDKPARGESRLYYSNILKPYPQLHVVDFVSDNVNGSLINDIARTDNIVINKKRRAMLQAIKS